MSNIELNKLQAAGKYSRVFSPLRIRHLELPNRVVFPPWLLLFGNADGTSSEKLLEFYRKAARGGCGLVFAGAAGVSPDTIVPGFENGMRADTDRYIPELRKIYSAITENGAVAGLQLAHVGNQAMAPAAGFDALPTPSGIPNPVLAQLSPYHKVRAITEGEILDCIDNFIAAGMRGVQAGYKIIEFHGGHGYFLHGFLSPRTNLREDQYGGTLEKRGRIVCDIIRGFRAKAGEDIIISLRVSGKEFLEGGIEPEDFKVLVPLFEQAGLDLLNVSTGTQVESFPYCMPGKEMGDAPNVPIAARLKSYASVPVITVGSIMSIKVAEQVLAEEKVDLVAMGRAQVADQELVKKTVSGRESEIRQCRRCNSCCFWNKGDTQMYCAVNPDYQK